ncbi:fimbrial protein [Rhodanobacter sp. MP7CTX1]|jgi:major type 1 subunit fimbrin (pilin)|uniref:fimbrial protein n=1 Tax=Rhodanobacter sp. MP7CTX1 TaxID=2723084 RepID=UPI0016210FD5|nr:fimbrial protein [Rhodanobacter sp. MP7CTX1]MBB6188684.1 major type 1 subunit fimbrin (pilin) [Rhodanobacter sp. MP7CTX1]
MKKTLISAALVAVMGVAAFTPKIAAAADGTITFNGKVTAQTCTINGNGTASNNFAVTLPTVSASALSATGAVAGRTQFNIALSACTPGTGNVVTNFEPGPTVAADGNLTNQATGGASNVEFQLLNPDLSAIVAGAPGATQNSKPVGLVAGAATLAYYSQYFATAAVTAGGATSTVQYDITYP